MTERELRGILREVQWQRQRAMWGQFKDRPKMPYYELNCITVPECVGPT